ncbi:hypothetical protein pEp_SNUABM04_00029 [Erwinia phage pEp_SNUABM_04]|nr:hypothetical protein pEp_SNUABM04_00029 [Erwinia phage pEp_SNUABM_04]QOC57786.1 putative HNS binding protein [Erwinia phage pEp_SNUABM_11]
MAMTKRGRVSFDFKFVMTSEEEADFQRDLLLLSRKVLEGGASGLEKAFVEAALEGGLEAALELNLKQGIQKLIKTECTVEGLVPANVRVTV